MKFLGKIFVYCFTKREFFGTLIEMDIKKFSMKYDEVRQAWYVKNVVPN